MADKTNRNTFREIAGDELLAMAGKYEKIKSPKSKGEAFLDGYMTALKDVAEILGGPEGDRGSALLNFLRLASAGFRELKEREGADPTREEV